MQWELRDSGGRGIAAAGRVGQRVRGRTWPIHVCGVRVVCSVEVCASWPVLQSLRRVRGVGEWKSGCRWRCWACRLEAARSTEAPAPSSAGVVVIFRAADTPSSSSLAPRAHSQHHCQLTFRAHFYARAVHYERPLCHPFLKTRSRRRPHRILVRRNQHIRHVNLVNSATMPPSR